MFEKNKATSVDRAGVTICLLHHLHVRLITTCPRHRTNPTLSFQIKQSDGGDLHAPLSVTLTICGQHNFATAEVKHASNLDPLAEACRTTTLFSVSALQAHHWQPKQGHMHHHQQQQYHVFHVSHSAAKATISSLGRLSVLQTS